MIDDNVPVLIDDSVPVFDLLKTVFESIVEVFVLCLAGLLLARVGIIDKATQRKINKINISLFTPCLLFSKVAFSLSPSKIKELWIVPLGFVVVTGTSMIVAWGLGTLFRLKRSQKSFAMAASMFQNSNSLPIALMLSLVNEVSGLKWDEDDTREAMLGRALTYLVLYSTLGMMLRWSYGIHLLTQADDDAVLLPPDGSPEEAGQSSSGATTAIEENPSAAQSHSDTSPLLAASSSNSNKRASSATFDDPWRDASSTSNGNGKTVTNSTVTPGGLAGNTPYLPINDSSSLPSTVIPARPRAPTRKSSNFHSFPNSPVSSVQNLSVVDSDDEPEENAEDEEWGDRNGDLATRRKALRKGRGGKWKDSALGRFGKKMGRVLVKVNEFMTVPMWSALLSIFIAMVPPLQTQLAKARPIRAAIKSAGNCSIPLTLVVLGAYFYSPQPASPPPTSITAAPDANANGLRKLWTKLRPSKAQAAIDKEMNKYPGEKRTVFVACVSRMIITPLILVPMVGLLARYDPFKAAEDPVFILTAVLIVSSPPAITLAQITQAASGDAFERLISKTIWVSYGLLTPPLTLLYVVLGLILSRL